MSIHAADALMGIFGFKRVSNYEKPLDNTPSLDDDSGSLNEGMEMGRTEELIRVLNAGVVERDARIATQEAQIKELQGAETSWQSGYDEGRRMGGKHCAITIDQLRAELAALNAKLDASKFCANVADVQQVSVPDCFESYRLADKFCEQRLVTDDHVRAIVVDAFASGYGFGIAAAPVAKQVVMQSTNFTASNGEQRNPRYQGQFEGETHDQAAYRLHWVTAAIESERLNAADQEGGV